MGSYKVSYKVLRQQGDDMKATAKLLDGYAEQVAKINGKLGDDALLAEVRKNLSKLREQLVESRAVINTAGEFLVSAVDGYSDVEVRQVKKVDGTKAHNRDFYKNPVVVASAGGAAGGAVVSSVAAPTSGGAGAVVAEPSPAAINYTENNTDNSVNVTYMESNSSSAAVSAAQPLAAAQPGMNQPVNAQATGAQPVPAAQNTSPAPAGNAAIPAAEGMSTAAKAAVGAAGAGAVAAGGIIGGREIKKRRSAQNLDNGIANESEAQEYDPEAELAKAKARVRELEEEE